ncbi:MAG: hypothetical protein IRZ26_01660 [Clostridia bacterium]|nr:hypothetical protein [Clostridia bacterium]
MEKKIPDFGSLGDVARFFDEHSAAELDLEPEDVRYEPKRSVLSVRFDPEEMIAIARLSRR